MGRGFSTNDLARTLPPRHIAVCRVQTGGRGRFNRQWIGEKGGLWASFTVPLDTPHEASSEICWGHLPLVAGVALLDMLRDMGIRNTRLRWPNDLLVGRSKLAGILVERPSDHMAVIGIGVNVFNDVAGIAGMVQDRPHVSRTCCRTVLPFTASWPLWPPIWTGFSPHFHAEASPPCGIPWP